MDQQCAKHGTLLQTPEIEGRTAIIEDSELPKKQKLHPPFPRVTFVASPPRTVCPRA